MRAIDADAFKEYITDACEDMKHLFNDGGAVAKLITESFCKDIDEQPTIQPKRGKWIDKGERGDWEWQADGRGRHWHEWECNTCHHYFAERSFFCPHCGSDMREVTE